MLCHALVAVAQPAPEATSPTPSPTPSPAVASDTLPSPVVHSWAYLFQNEQPPPESSADPLKRRDKLISALRVLRAEDEKNKSAVSGQIELELQNILQQLLTAPNESAFADGLKKLSALYDPKVLADAHALAEKFRCPMHPESIGKQTDLCPKCGMTLTSPIRLAPVLIPLGANRHTIKSRIETDGPLQVGVEVHGHLNLASIVDNQPITYEELREVHTRRIHLLVIDGSLTDYHHVHPTPTDVPGRYDFAFTPQKPGPYRLWADLQPIETDLQEFALALINADSHAEPLVKNPDRLTSEVNGLHYVLSFDRPLKSGEPAEGLIRVTQEAGAPFTQLEPVMSAFAHIVGFREDRTTALHIHPEITKPLVETDRGGPDLRFRFYAAKPGYYRLFAQIQRHGAQEFAPFEVNVAQGPLPPGMEKNYCSSGESRPTVFPYGIRITEITLRQ